MFLSAYVFLLDFLSASLSAFLSTDLLAFVSALRLVLFFNFLSFYLFPFFSFFVSDLQSDTIYSLTPEGITTFPDAPAQQDQSRTLGRGIDGS